MAKEITLEQITNFLQGGEENICANDYLFGNSGKKYTVNAILPYEPENRRENPQKYICFMPEGLNLLEERHESKTDFKRIYPKSQHEL